MKSITLHEAKAKLSGLVAEVERSGERMVLTRYGKPVAQLTPVRGHKRTRTVAALSKVTVNGDLTEPTGDEWEDA